jgi:homoserine dehydrogenase
MTEVGVGLIGFGTVGAGVVEALQRNGDVLAQRLGIRLVLRGVADLDLARDRGVTVDPGLLTRDAAAVVGNPAVQIVIELVGGLTAARDIVLEALRLGKPVVTANKALLAEKAEEIFGAAAERKVELGFEASVAGGIPIIRAVREGLVANRIVRIYGILNGTCNYILTRMERDQMTFEHALKEAQAAGYAEADPALDIDGVDTAHKAVILASLASGVPVPMAAAHVEGIRGLPKADIEYARGLGYRIKLLAVIRHDDGGLEVRVHPTLIPADHMLASVSGVFNAVMVEGDLTGPTAYYGRGAGRLPTASAVISDVAEVARTLVGGARQRVPVFTRPPGEVRLREIGEIETRYYLRCSLLDRPGVLGRLTTVLGRHGVSIASVLQKEVHAGRHVPVVIVTHPARERDFTAAVREIDAMDVVGAKSLCLRIEGFGPEK